MQIEEEELTRRRSIGTFGKAIDLTELTMQKQDLLLQRRLDRIESNGWTALTTNAISITSPTQGTVLFSDSYFFRTYSPRGGVAQSEPVDPPHRLPQRPACSTRATASRSVPTRSRT